MGLIIVLAIFAVILFFCVRAYLRSRPTAGGAGFELPRSPYGYLCFPDPGNDHEAALWTTMALMNVIPEIPVQLAPGHLMKEVHDINPRLPRSLSADDCQCILKRYQWLDYINADRNMIEFARKRGISCSYYTGGRDLIDALRDSMTPEEEIAFFIACVGCNEDGSFFDHRWNLYLTAAEKAMNTPGFMDSFEKQFADESWFYDCGSQFRQTKAYKIAKELDDNL